MLGPRRAKPQNPEPAGPKTQASLMKADPIKARKAKKLRKHRPAARAVSCRKLVKDGFVIRTTDFIPADAVTRQSGKGFFGRCHCHVAEVDFHCGLLLHAEGLCR